MKQKTKYTIILVLSFVLYGNTLFHDYALDDAIVITENYYTLSGFDGIKDIFKYEFFSGFFGQEDKKLVAGGRYRPLSMATFAIEWQLVMGSPLKDINKPSLEKRLNKNTKPQFVSPYRKLVKELSKTIHIENSKNRIQLQKSILNRTELFNNNEKTTILSNLKEMKARRSVILFISHLMNVLLYAFTCIILLRILENIFTKDQSGKWYTSLPFVATLLFLAHPIHTEVVANIKGRDEILSLLGALLSMFFTLKYIHHKKKLYLFLSFMFFLAGIFAKEQAVTFVAIIPLTIYFFFEKSNDIRNIIMTIIPALIASIIYFYVRGRILEVISFEPGNELMNNSFLGMAIQDKYATIFYTLLLYVKLLIFPHPLTYDYYPYHIPAMEWGIWPIVSLLFYVGIGIFALIGLKKKSIISYGILFYLISFSPVSNVLFPIGVFMNERFVYAASIGFVIILAYFFTNKLPHWVKTKNTIVLAMVMVLGLYSIKTISRNRAWKNDLTLFTTDVKTSVNSAKSNTSAGGRLIEEAIKPENKNKRVEYLNLAIPYLRKAISIHPTYDDALLLMGNAQWELYRNLDSVYTYYELILKRFPRYDRVYANIFESKINLIFDDVQKAPKNAAVLHKLEKYHPNHFHINYNLGRIYGRYLNNLSLSKQYLEKAAVINPGNVVVFKDLGVAYGISGEYKKSAGALRKAIALDPQDPVLRINLAMTYANLRQFTEALKILDAAFAMDFKKEDATTLVNMGNLYVKMGNALKGRQCIERAQELNPDLFKK